MRQRLHSAHWAARHARRSRIQGSTRATKSGYRLHQRRRRSSLSNARRNRATDEKCARPSRSSVTGPRRAFDWRPVVQQTSTGEEWRGSAVGHAGILVLAIFSHEQLLRMAKSFLQTKGAISYRRAQTHVTETTVADARWLTFEETLPDTIPCNAPRPRRPSTTKSAFSCWATSRILLTASSSVMTDSTVLTP